MSVAISANEPSVAEVVGIKEMKPNKALTLNNGKMFKLCTSATILATLCYLLVGFSSLNFN